MTQLVPATANLGPTYTGLTIGYTLYDTDQVEYAAWTSSGVAEAPAGSGQFHVAVTAPVAGGWIAWGESGTEVIRVPIDRYEISVDLSDISDALDELQADVDTMAARLEAQAPGGAPVVSVPAPDDGQISAYIVALDETGVAASGVVAEVRLQKAGNSPPYSYSKAIQSDTTDVDGLASFALPSGTHLRFEARAGGGNWVAFDGAVTDTVVTCNTVIRST